jgi:hypothetical protein
MLHGTTTAEVFRQSLVMPCQQHSCRQTKEYTTLLMLKFHAVSSSAPRLSHVLVHQGITRGLATASRFDPSGLLLECLCKSILRISAAAVFRLMVWLGVSVSQRSRSETADLLQ